MRRPRCERARIRAIGLRLTLVVGLAALGAPLSTTAVTFDDTETLPVVLGGPDRSFGPDSRRPDRTFEDPTKVQVDGSGRVIVADTRNHRAALFSALPASDGAPFDAALLQTALTNHGSACGYVQSAAIGGGRAAVAIRIEFDNGSAGGAIRLFDTLPGSTSNAYNRTLGSACSGGSLGAPAATSIRDPADVWTDGTRLLVADADYNRVMVWNAWPTVASQAPDLVLGQPNATTGTANTGGMSAATMNGPRGVWSDGTRILVADTGNNRVLVWNSWPGATGAAATFVLGQAATNASVTSCTTTGLNAPQGVSSDGTRIVIADTGNHRVVAHDAWPVAHNRAVERALGQANRTTCTRNRGLAAVAANTLSDPTGVSTDGTRVLVADRAAHRVLAWTSWPATDGASAQRVLGHTSMSAAGHNDAGLESVFTRDTYARALPPRPAVAPDGSVWVAGSGRVVHYATPPASDTAAPTDVYWQDDDTHSFCNRADGIVGRDTTCRPGGIWTDGTRLLVADTDNNRVLGWTSMPTGPDDPADVVLGQPNGTTTSCAAASASSLCSPLDVSSDGTRIAVAEPGRNRVLVWNAWPGADGIAANVVVGQPDAVTTTANTAGRSASSLSEPTGVALGDGRLAVADAGNDRVLVWSSVPAVTGTAATAAQGVADFVSAGALWGAHDVDLASNALFYTHDLAYVLDPAPLAGAANRTATVVGSFATIADAKGISARDGSAWMGTAENGKVVRADDGQAPQLTNVPVLSFAGSVATVTWNTSESGTSELYWDSVSRAAVGAYAASSTSSAMSGLTHARTTPALAAGNYFYRVRTVDWDGREAVSAEGQFGVGGPTITDNQPGDTAWRRTNVATYDVDLADASGLDRFEVRVAEDDLGSVLLQDWTQVQGSLAGTSLTTDWALPASTWTALREGDNRVWIRAWDDAGILSVLPNAFIVRKDTRVAAPEEVADGALVDRDHQAATNSLVAHWRPIEGEAEGSGVDRYERCFSSLPNCAGTVLSTWTSTGTATTSTLGSLGLAAGTTWYASVRSVDLVGNVSAVTSSDGIRVGTTASSTTLTTTGCTGSAVDLGLVPAGSTAVTGSDCVLGFGAAGTTADLRISQSDRGGAAAVGIPDGRLDPTFGVGGIAEHPAPGFSWDLYGGDMTIQPDGKILHAGRNNQSGDRVQLQRLLPNGGLDTTFGTGGSVVVDVLPGDSSWAEALAVQDDGRIVVAGVISNVGVTSAEELFVLRLLPDGSADGSFGPGGIRRFAIDQCSCYVTQSGISIDGQGRIVVATFDDDSTPNDDLAIVRLLSDGTPDPAFGTGGTATLDYGSWERAYDVAHDAAGRLVVSGDRWNGSKYELAVWRVLTDGSKDLAFDGDGMVTRDLGGTSHDRGKDLHIDRAGRTWIGGSSDHLFVARMLANGTWDATYGTGGVVEFDQGHWGSEESISFLVAPTGHAYVAGGSDLGGSSTDLVVFRITPSGVLDTTFDEDGHWTRYEAGYDSFWGIEVARDGSIVAGGTTGSVSSTVRFAAPNVPDFQAGVNDFSSGSGAFGVCLRAIGGANVATAGSWSATGSCPTTTNARWRAVPTTPAQSLDARMARTTLAGALDGSASLRFGVRPPANTPPGSSYAAQVVVEVVAPEV